MCHNSDFRSSRADSSALGSAGLSARSKFLESAKLNHQLEAH
jgi:hypothetical protein